MAKKAKRKTAARRSAGGARGPGAVDARGKTLVIVESPAKARTINRYLGDDYVVRASMGHVRDLPQRDFGVDLEHDFAPTYVPLQNRRNVLGPLSKMAAQADRIMLATDLDREGEAIAWHLAEALNVPDDRIGRVIFNQITKAAIQEAFRDPHAIDMDKVNAQQARRILDRIVGYQVSPLLWRKVRRGLSAGRVQTVAVRIIVEREREIRAFVAEEYWRIGVELTPDGADAAARAGEALKALLASADPEKGLSKQALFDFYAANHLVRCELVEWAGEKFRPDNQAFAHDAAAALGQATYAVAGLKTSERQDKPAGPFTTAALQQAAANQLGFRTSQTMRIAQQLYEGVEIGESGPTGLITYMRTDSMNLAPEAVAAAREFIGGRFGAAYLPDQPQRYTASAGAQEAHEAVRPTDVTRTPQDLRGYLDEQQFKLYDLIWRRFVACQMAPARWQTVTMDVRAECPGDAGSRVGMLRASARKLLFDGHLAVTERRDTPEPMLPEGVAEGAAMFAARVDPTQHFTEPPPRYSEATLVKAMEAEGIGRPSTYASIIDTIQSRHYVELRDRRFHPTALGEVVTDMLIAAFPTIFDVEFTRFMESELDKIEEAHLDWVHVLREFYEPFSERLAEAGDKMVKPVEESPYPCPKCGGKLMYRIGRAGRFLGCANYPQCDHTADVNDAGEPIERKEVDAKCPECGSAMLLRRGRTGVFLGCTRYPECNGTLPCADDGTPLKLVEPDEIEMSCPDCGSPMQAKFARGRSFMGCSRYPDCKGTAPIPEGLAVKRPKAKVIETGIACEKCQRPMVVRTGRKGMFLACTGFPRCRNTRNLTKAERASIETTGYLEAAEPNGASPDPSADGKKTAKRSTKKKASKAKAESPAAAGQGPDAAAAAEADAVGGELGELMKQGCPQCHGPVQLRSSRFGPFLGCRNYPTCKGILKVKGDALKQARVQLGLPEKPAKKEPPKVTDVSCSKCGKPMVIRSGLSGKFLGCSGYPSCRNTAPLPVELTRADEK
ncbi:MAG: DNA topoisomerase 1 [Phycisphaerae bacterium]|nr:DNA topoisomerase 1 [Phycisphaerae bacterium]